MRATWPYFNSSAHLPLPSFPSLSFHSLLSSFMLSACPLALHILSGLTLLVILFSPSQSQTTSSVTLALVLVYIYSLLVVVTKYLYDSVQHRYLCPWSPISPPDCSRPRRHQNLHRPPPHHHPSFHDVHLSPHTRCHPRYCLSCRSLTRGRRRGHLVISCSPGYNPMCR
ncbi:hypothetical protein BGY98DRAFT_14289 [Russula aff. rugulosa BPL654]|nr:hypothetical protein BGY98DRAFT_14289 [Russula aff. rugulosa BPL654]